MSSKFQNQLLMPIHGIPPHLRCTVDQVDLPIYAKLTPEDLFTPPELALGDTLMMLGLVRNQGRPVRVHLNPGPNREIVESHPLVREIVPTGDELEDLALEKLPVSRYGRRITWVSRVTHNLKLGVRPVNQVRFTPCLAHSLHFGLDHRDDRPSLFLDPGRPPALAGLLGGRPLLVVYPVNPGRGDGFWSDPEWWTRLLRRARRDFDVVAVGARRYGELEGEVDAALSMNDPSSTLLDVAWLISRAAAYVGMDGGPSHLAAAVNPRTAVVWDSVSSYRYWASSACRHLLFSNPYTFRYPQTTRLSAGELRSLCDRVEVSDGKGGAMVATLPQSHWEETVIRLMGSVEALAQWFLTVQEKAEERAGVEAWMSRPEEKEAVYRRSLDFAWGVITGVPGLPSDWVIPSQP